MIKPYNPDNLKLYNHEHSDLCNAIINTLYDKTPKETNTKPLGNYGDTVTTKWLWCSEKQLKVLTRNFDNESVSNRNLVSGYTYKSDDGKYFFTVDTTVTPIKDFAKVTFVIKTYNRD